MVEEIMVEKLISSLQRFAEEDFPVPTVSKHLQNLSLNDNSLDDYIFKIADETSLSFV